jgi:hypothetical protein
MASISEMMEMIRQYPLVDVVMKCGQVVCGQVADLEGEFMVVNEPDRGASSWIRQEEIAFVRLHPPLESVRYPEDERQRPSRSAYGSPYMPTVVDEPLPGYPTERRPGRVALAPDMRSRLEQVKERHRTAEFVTSRHEGLSGLAGRPQLVREEPQVPPEHSPGQVYRPRIEDPGEEEPF